MGTESTSEGITVGDVVDAVERAYPPALAESWDAVGLVCGDRSEPVRRVLACVDVTDAVVDAAVAEKADLVIAHHPLLMRGVTSVAADTPKGRIVHRLIRHGIALLSAHTNADRARPGVSDALADLLGVVDTVPIEPKSAEHLDKWVVMVPEGNVDHVAIAFAAGHAGHAARLVLGCERNEPPQASSRDHRIFARQLKRDLSEVHGIETMAHPVSGPSTSTP